METITGKIIKKRMNFYQLLVQLKDGAIDHAEFPKPTKIMVDLQKIAIPNSDKILILIKDNSLVR